LTGANVAGVRASLTLRRARALAVLASGLLVALFAACGGGDGIRISAVTSTPSTGASGTASATSATLGEVTPTPLPVPQAPENAFAGGRLIEAYLAEGEPDIEGCLPEVVEEWGLAPEVDGLRCASIDLDGDRAEEFVFLVSFGSGADDTSAYAADLWFFEDKGSGYRFFNSARALANASTAALRIRSTDDLTSDGLPDVVMTWDECSEDPCVTHVSIASFHNGALENLAPTDADVPALEEFTMDGGVISLVGGLSTDVAVGPQRTSTVVVRWAGARFRTEIIEGEPVYLIHLVNDADALYNAGSFPEAREAYLAIATNNSLPDWKSEIGQEDGRIELQAYATFRAAITAFKQNDLIGAGQLLERTATQFPSTMHGSAAIQYLLALAGGAPPEAACGAAETFLDAVNQQYLTFWDYGSANPERTVFSLCR